MPGRSAKYNAASQDVGDVGHDLAREIDAMSRGSIAGTTTGAGAVDRHSSVRSVQTLPAYMAKPGESERVLGREGERAGIDVVVEYPETAEEEEERREEEMEGLYRLRLARQADSAAREERRAARRAAREAGDSETLNELRRQDRERTQSNATATTPGGSDPSLPIPALQIEAATRPGRERRISSVSYAEVGLARADGTRIRAGSTESDQRPLLDGAAPIDTSRPGSASHFRHHSTSSAQSLSDAGSDTHPEPTPPAQVAEFHDQDPSSPLPPTYDEAPPYERPSNVPPRLPSVRALPVIEVTAGTPTNSTPATPVSRETSMREYPR